MCKYLALTDNDLREHLPALDTGIYSGQLTRYKAYVNFKTDKDECFLNPSDFKYIPSL